MRTILITMVVFLTSSFSFSTADIKDKVKAWISPPEADNIINPYQRNTFATAEGKKIYVQICFICHGDKGKGDGLGGLALVPRPADLATLKVQGQTDGAIFWKITEGRPPMASYKTTYSEIQRWQLVNFLRTFNKIKK